MLLLIDIGFIPILCSSIWSNSKKFVFFSSTSKFSSRLKLFPSSLERIWKFFSILVYIKLWRCKMILCNDSGKQCMSRRDAGILINRFRHHHKVCGKYPRRYYFCKSCGTYHVTSLKYFVA